MTRQEHLDWSKERALEYLADGNVHGAFNSIASDLGKHPETRGHDAIKLGFMLLEQGHLDQPIKMRDFIEGFH